ncbi:phosphodiesterase [Acidovorax sp. Root219]|uniref:phosphodiesterase n=1 Tax=Acidovorax sp. Root219 TaxID=1736493 RepID=UPI00070F5A6F|nr:phosphodiesterase [Acidovorax sp. Root219]KRC34357.1 metallophosphatase [Acidovorax sp. Root219]
MLIAQLSDPHVREAGVFYQRVVDSNRMFAQALAHLHALDRRPDLIVLTGDLVDHGRPAEYQEVRRLLVTTSIPWLAMAGNHDEREAFRAAFHDQAYLARAGALHFCVDDHPVRIVAFDSCIPGRHHGRVDAAALAWLDATLSEARNKPTLLMLHHPPFTSGIPYMDDYRCTETEGLEAVVRAHPQVERVLCGHVHRSMLRRWAGTVVCTAPSTTTEICLQLRPDAAPASVVGPAGCLLHLWDPVHGMVSHLSHIGRFEGPYPFA